MFGKLNIVAVADFRRAPGEVNSSLDEAVTRLNDQGSRRGLYAIIRKHQPGKVENGRRPRRRTVSWHNRRCPFVFDLRHAHGGKVKYTWRPARESSVVSRKTALDAASVV